MQKMEVDSLPDLVRAASRLGLPPPGPADECGSSRRFRSCLIPGHRRRPDATAVPGADGATSPLVAHTGSSTGRRVGALLD
jgi:hypothetical protein